MSDVEDVLRSALRAARSDARWDVTPRRVALAGVLRDVQRRRRRVQAAAVTTTLVALVSGGLVLDALTGSRSETLRPAAPPVTSPLPTPVPSVTPAWRPTSPRDWLLTHEQYLAFSSTHQVERPTSPPGQVASPAPLTPVTATLAARAQVALPPGTAVDRDDAPGGEAGVAALHVTLPDGSPLEVQQRQLTEPEDVSEGLPVTEAPGSDVLYSSTTSSAGFGFPGQPDGVHAVYLVDRRGRLTTWYAPVTVPLTTLTDWALTAGVPD